MPTIITLPTGADHKPLLQQAMDDNSKAYVLLVNLSHGVQTEVALDRSLEKEESIKVMERLALSCLIKSLQIIGIKNLEQAQEFIAFALPYAIETINNTTHSH